MRNKAAVLLLFCAVALCGCGGTVVDRRQASGIRPDMLERLESFRFGELRFTNFEMEGSALAGLAALMGHRAATLCTIIAQRVSRDADTDYRPYVERMIDMALEKLCSLPEEE